MDLPQEKGAFSWLISLPIEEFDFALCKGAFHDALGLWYNWTHGKIQPDSPDCPHKGD